MKLDQIVADGTKIKAHASKHAVMSCGRMEKEERRLREDIVCYFVQVKLPVYGEKPFGIDDQIASIDAIPNLHPPKGVIAQTDPASILAVR